MTWGLVSRLTALLAAVLIAPLADVFGVPVSATAVAAPAAYSYDAATHAYDGPARLSSPHSVARDARGSPSGPGAVSWGRSVSVGGVVVAANTAARGGGGPGDRVLLVCSERSMISRGAGARVGDSRSQAASAT